MDWNQEKRAALKMLVDKGVDFDTAADLVEKKAGALSAAAKDVGSALLGKAKSVGSAIAADAKRLPGQAKMVATGKTPLTKSPVSRAVVGKDLLQNKALAAGLGGAAALGAGAMAMGREKQAAVGMLISEYGVDFDLAVDLVQAKSDELYSK